MVGGDPMISIKSLQSAVKMKKEGEDIQKIENIPVQMIKPNPYQPRKTFSQQSLEELAQSIKEFGLIQPITVRKTGVNGYELIAGERRLRATKLANLDYIPAVIITTDERDSAVLAMIENLQRENLHYLEEAAGYASLIEDHGFTQEELAKKLGKNQSTIANKLRVLKLPKEVKDLLIKHNLTERHARALLRLPDTELQLKIIDKIVEKGLNVKETENLISNVIEKIQQNNIKKSKKKMIRNYKDLRLFVNTIKNAVSMLKDYGVAPVFKEIDREDCIEIIVTIPKG